MRQTEAEPPDIWPGEVGFMMLKYVGGSPAVRRWKGAITGIRYPFGPGDVRYVDARDGVYFLRGPFKHDKDEGH